jgi:hypothetical protein
MMTFELGVAAGAIGGGTAVAGAGAMVGGVAVGMTARVAAGSAVGGAGGVAVGTGKSTWPGMAVGNPWLAVNPTWNPVCWQLRSTSELRMQKRTSDPMVTMMGTVGRFAFPESIRVRYTI